MTVFPQRRTPAHGHIFLVFSCVLTLLGSSSSSIAKIYYVDGAVGSDTNPGTSRAAAWATIGKAWDKIDDGTIGAGDTILIRPGRYYVLHGPTSSPPPHWIEGAPGFTRGGSSGSPLTISVDTFYPGNLELTGSATADFTMFSGGTRVSTPWAAASTECTSSGVPWSCCTGSGTGCAGIYFTEVNMNAVGDATFYGPGTCFQPGVGAGAAPKMWEILYDNSASAPIDMPTFTSGRNQCWFRVEDDAICIGPSNPWRCCSGNGTGSCSERAYVYAQTSSGGSPASLSPSLEFPVAANAVNIGNNNPIAYLSFTNHNNGRRFYFWWGRSRTVAIGGSSHHMIFEDFDIGYAGGRIQARRDTTYGLGYQSGSGFPRGTSANIYLVLLNRTNTVATHHNEFRRGNIHKTQGDEALHIMTKSNAGTNPATCTVDDDCTETSLGTALGCLENNKCYYLDEPNTGFNTFEDLNIYDIPWEILNEDTSTYGYSYSWPPSSHSGLPSGCTPGTDCWQDVYISHFSPLGGGGRSQAITIDRAHDETYRRIKAWNVYSFRLESEKPDLFGSGSQVFSVLVEDSVFDFTSRQYAGDDAGTTQPSCATCWCGEPLANGCNGYSLLGAINTESGAVKVDFPGHTFRNNIFHHIYGPGMGDLNIGYSGQLTGTQFVNNVFHFSGPRPRRKWNEYRINLDEDWGTAASPIVFKNNIIRTDETVTPAYATVHVNSAATSEVSIDYNLYYGTTMRWQWGPHAATASFTQWKADTGETQDTNSPAPADPHFLDVSSNNFHINVTSPARDAGVTLPGFSSDIDGDTRPQRAAWDIGADEYRSTIRLLDVTPLP